MKTLIFNGSPRKNGDTVSLINILKDELQGEIKVVDAYYCDVKPCIDCRFCWKNPGCTQKDEMTEIYEYIEECDNIIIASPIYFTTLTGKLLDVISRLQTYFSAKFLRKEHGVPDKKYGAIILVGGGMGAMDGAVAASEEVLKLLNCQQILPTVCSHNTDRKPAIDDEQAVIGVKEIARKINESNK